MASDNALYRKLGDRIINYSMLFSVVLVFFYMMWLLSKYHRFEYETNLKKLLIFMTNMTLYVSFQTAITEIVNTGDVMTSTLCFFRNSHWWQALFYFVVNVIDW